MARFIKRLYKTGADKWVVQSFRESVGLAKCKTDSLTGIGWQKEVKENVIVQEMSDGRFCIMKVCSWNEKGGYKVYPGIETMKEDFELITQEQPAGQTELKSHQTFRLMGAKMLTSGALVTPEMVEVLNSKLEQAS